MNHFKWRKTFDSELRRAFSLFLRLQPRYINNKYNAMVWDQMLCWYQQVIENKGREWIPATEDLIFIYRRFAFMFERQISLPSRTIRRSAEDPVSNNWLEFFKQEMELPDNPTETQNFKTFMELMMEEQ